ncbi:MAG TPA: LysR substrate-binding domain-containing protein [Bryobacteraceae bacterium]|nr:LysR substrate-binding domain-containing protein [Bryobacteraceae bacterium]
MESPTLRQLRYFLAVAGELHFGRAAERAGIAQPPLTQQIQKLEGSLGCQLLVRGRKTRLTPAGIALAADAQRLLDQVDQAFDRARRTARGEIGQLRVGVPPSVMLTALPASIRRYRQLYSSVSFTLREMATSAIEEALRRREIDLGFLRETKPQNPLGSALFLTERIVVVLPAAHPLASRSSINLRQLKPEPFVLFPPQLGPAFHQVLIGACVSAGFAPRIVQEATQWQTIISLVEAGMGISLAPECVTRFRRAGVTYRVLPHAITNVYASWYQGEMAPAVDRFLKVAATRMAARSQA